jgi:hypothetical protein
MVFFRMLDRWEHRIGAGPGRNQANQQFAPKLDHPLDHFIGAFPDNDLFAIAQGKNCVRSILDKLNQVRIDGKRAVVESRETYHGDLSSNVAHLFNAEKLNRH